MKIIVGITVFLIIYGFIEYHRHLRTLKRIPLRIHVNGTRGKSSVTRLIAAGLNYGGIRTVAKTTGGVATIILEDGSEQEIVRRGIPNIKEQLGIVRQAAQQHAECLVVECMAVRPELQRICEHKIIKSHIGVITNVRRDHLDKMGPELVDVARSLSLTIPKGGHLFTTEKRFTDVLAERAKQVDCTLHTVDSEQSLDGHELNGFNYLENAENLALALNVCEHVGVDRNVALQGMKNLRAHVDVLQQFELERDGKIIHFVSAFAANDNESIVQVFAKLHLSPDNEKPLIVIVNLRADRPQRAHDLGELLGEELKADYFLLVGELTHAVKRIAIRNGCPKEKLLKIKRADPHRVITEILRLTPQQSVGVGIGNMGGFGRAMSDFLKSEASQI